MKFYLERKIQSIIFRYIEYSILKIKTRLEVNNNLFS